MRVISTEFATPVVNTQREITVDDDSVLSSAYSDGFLLISTAKELTPDDTLIDVTRDFPVVSVDSGKPLQNLNLALTSGSKLYVTCSTTAGAIRGFLLFKNPAEL